MEPLYEGEPILAVAAVDELTAAEAIEKIQIEFEPLPFAVDPIASLRPGSANARDTGQRLDAADAAGRRRRGGARGSCKARKAAQAAPGARGCGTAAQQRAARGRRGGAAQRQDAAGAGCRRGRGAGSGTGPRR